MTFAVGHAPIGAATSAPESGLWARQLTDIRVNNKAAEEERGTRNRQRRRFPGRKLGFTNKEERRRGHVRAYLHRHINDTKGNDDDDEDWRGRADHDKGADDPQEAQNPAAQGHGEGVVHRGNILGTQLGKMVYDEFLRHFRFS